MSGTERYLRPYLDLIAALTGVGDISEAIIAVDESFKRRNRDRRLPPHAQDFDGNGHDPQAVDFRTEALLARGGADAPTS